MPIITIQQASGRTVEQRRRLTAKLTEVFCDVYQLPPESVTVFFQDYDGEFWGKEGKLHADRIAERK